MRQREEEGEYTAGARRCEWRRKERKEGECSYSMELLEAKGTKEERVDIRECQGRKGEDRKERTKEGSGGGSGQGREADAKDGRRF